MQHRDKIIVQKIADELRIGLDMLGERSLEDFMQDEVLKRALAMTVINIGELVKNITMETREANQQIPWKEMAGMRDIAAHRYQTLRMEDVYCTVKDDFSTLVPLMKELLSQAKQVS